MKSDNKKIECANIIKQKGGVSIYILTLLLKPYTIIILWYIIRLSFLYSCLLNNLTLHT